MSRVAWRPISSMKRSRRSGSSLAPDWSASTALVIAVTGVRSSCEALVTNSRSAWRRRSCSVMSANTSTTRSDDDAGTPTSEIIAPSSRWLRASATDARGTKSPSATRRSGSPPCVSGSGAPFSSGTPASSSFAFAFANCDAQVAVDGEHALVHLLEHALEPVALGAQLLEGRRRAACACGRS